jgi:hypothetical protein
VYRSEDEGRFVFEMVSMEKVGDFNSIVGMLHLGRYMNKFDIKDENFINTLLNNLYVDLKEADEEHLVELILANLTLSKGIK